MKTKTLNKLLKDYAKIFENLGFKLNPDFKKDYLHIKRMKTNGTKISFIKPDKIKGLQENIKGFKLKPNNQEQREKYFQAVKPSKFLDNMLLKHNRNSIFSGIAEEFNKAFIYNLKNNLHLYSGEDIGEQYSVNGSICGCMSGCNANWFDVYRDTEGLQLATLKDEGNTMLVRALLWYDKKNKSYWLDNSYEQGAINGDSEVREQYQLKLLRQVLEHLTKKHQDKTLNFGCAYACRLNSEAIQEVSKEFDTTIYKQASTYGSDKDRLKLEPIINDFDIDNYECYPYSDTFQSLDKDSGQWDISDNSGDSDYICFRSTEGEDENDTGVICECCSNRVSDEDYIHYSECEEAYICDDCSTYIEERDECVMSDNATYNNYTGNYHYTPDIE